MPTAKKKTRRTARNSRTRGKSVPVNAPSGEKLYTLPEALKLLTLDGKTLRRGRGRPRKTVNKPFLMLMAKIGATYDEISAAFTLAGEPISVDTLKRNFADQIEAGRSSGKVSLRLAQWMGALRGNPRLLEWLGKQELGQRDKTDIKHTGGRGLADLLEDVPATEPGEEPELEPLEAPPVRLPRGNRGELPA